MANNISNKQARAFISKVKRALKPRRNAAGDLVALQYVGLSDIQPLLSFLRQEDAMAGVKISRMPDDPMQIHYTSAESVVVACERELGQTVPERGVEDAINRRGAMYRVVEEAPAEAPAPVESSTALAAKPATAPEPQGVTADVLDEEARALAEEEARAMASEEHEPGNVVLDADDAVDGFAVVDDAGDGASEIPAPVELEQLRLNAVEAGMSSQEADALDRDALVAFLGNGVNA